MAASPGLVEGEGVVFLHGAGGTSLVWQLQALTFPRASIPDLPGRAGTPHPETIPGFLDALADALEPADVVVGHSLGGAIAMAHALRGRGTLKGLVLVATGAHLRVRPDWLDGLERDAESVTAEIVDHFFAIESPKGLKQKTLRQVRALAPGILKADLRAADGFDARGRVGGILAPVLIVCGSADRMTPLALSESLHAILPRSELVVVDGAGHMVMLEQPRRVNEAIRAFLKKMP